MEKFVKKYAQIYRVALNANNFSDIDLRVKSYEQRLKKMLATVEKVIDILPNTYQIAKKWNSSDHENRVEDGSITYDYFNVTEGKIEYCISKCMYIEMFEYYGIRSLCKIFCLTDEAAYANLTRHVKFIRHSDLSDSTCCHDEVWDKKQYKE